MSINHTEGFHWSGQFREKKSNKQINNFCNHASNAVYQLGTGFHTRLTLEALKRQLTDRFFTQG